METTGVAPPEEAPSREELLQQVRSQTRWLMAGIALICLMVGGVIGHFATAEPLQPADDRLAVPAGWEQPCLATAGGTETPFLPTTTPSPLHVYVSGAVHAPQVVTLTAGSLVIHALTAAGGPTADADLEQLNLAAPLADHQHLVVPRRGMETPTVALPAPTGTATAPVGPLLNINTASAAELEQLPRIGPTTAQRIVEYRQTHGPFQRIEDIQQVPGIGPAIFAEIQPHITVGP